MLVFLVEVEGDSTQKENEGKVYCTFKIPFMFACGGKEVQIIILCMNLSNWHNICNHYIHSLFLV